MFQDRKEIKVGDKVYIIRQRSLMDLYDYNKTTLRYAGNTTGEPILLAMLLWQAMRHDNYTTNIPIIKKLFKVTPRWIMKRFSFQCMRTILNEITDLETYKEKKKTENPQV